MAIAKLNAEIREEIGKNRVDKVRKEDFIPGVVYGKGEKTRHIKVDKKQFQKYLRKHGQSALLHLELDGEKLPVIIKEIQSHPFKNYYLHIDFQQLRMDEKVKMTLPITLIGRENIQIKPSILVQQLDEIEIECLPTDIPEKLEADVSHLDFSTALFVKDLEIFNNENITVLRDADDTVATLTEPISEEELEALEEDVEEPEATDVEVIGEEDVVEEEEQTEETEEE